MTNAINLFRGFHNIQNNTGTRVYEFVKLCMAKKDIKVERYCYYILNINNDII